MYMSHVCRANVRGIVGNDQGPGSPSSSRGLLSTRRTTSGHLTLVLDNVNPEVEPGVHLSRRAVICMAMRRQSSKMTVKHAGV